MTANLDFVRQLGEELLSLEFPFLRWPRETVRATKFEWAAPNGGGSPFLEYNYTQTFITEGDRSLAGLMRHLREVQDALSQGTRHKTVDQARGRELTWTAGCEYWDKIDYYEVHGFTLMIFADRLLQHAGKGGAWLSDVGVRPHLTYRPGKIQIPPGPVDGWVEATDLKLVSEINRDPTLRIYRRLP